MHVATHTREEHDCRHLPVMVGKHILAQRAKYTMTSWSTHGFSFDSPAMGKSGQCSRVGKASRNTQLA